MVRKIVVAIAAWLLALTVLAAADSGMDAYNAEDYAKALTLWKPLAEQGNAEAQYGMALLYDDGYGVPRDETQAILWYRKAAAPGLCRRAIQSRRRL